jgi:alkylated DNA nucleotide flippase Atl1
MARTKSAWAKMRCGKQPCVKTNLPAMIAKWMPRGLPQEKWSMLISSPEEVEQFIAEIPPGRAVTLTELRQELARRHNAAIACPMSTAIFVNIVARAYAERETKEGTPSIGWWRVLTSAGKLNPKFPGGVQEQGRRLRAEGVSLESFR